jgi:hypothetical protein
MLPGDAAYIPAIQIESPVSFRQVSRPALVRVLFDSCATREMDCDGGGPRPLLRRGRRAEY